MCKGDAVAVRTFERAAEGRRSGAAGMGAETAFTTSRQEALAVLVHGLGSEAIGADKICQQSCSASSLLLIEEGISVHFGIP